MKFIYKGNTVSSVTISDQEIVLFPGSEVELPDCEYAQTLVALGLLEEVRETRKRKEVTENAG